MRIVVSFNVNEDRIIRTSFNEAMTAFIYRCIGLADKEYADKLHSEGYKQSGKHKFIYHTYSITQGRKLVSKSIKKGVAKLTISSAIEDTIIKFVKGLMKIGDVQLYGRSYNIESIEYIKEPRLSKSQMFILNSPVYIEDIEGKWLQPDEMEDKIPERLLENYHTLYKRLPKNTELRAKFINSSKYYIDYKSSKFRGVMGTIVLEGSKELIDLAYKIGVGSRTGLGFGLLDVPYRR